MKQYDSRLAGYAEPLSDNVYTQLLAGANTEETITIATGAKYVVLSGTAVFFARLNNAAATPVGDVVDGTGSFCIPVPRTFRIQTGDATIHVVSPTAGMIVTAEWFA